MEMCPKFIRCSVNRCPLDPEMEIRDIPLDGEPVKCRLEKDLLRNIVAKAAEKGITLGLGRTRKSRDGSLPVPGIRTAHIQS